MKLENFVSITHFRQKKPKLSSFKLFSHLVTFSHLNSFGCAAQLCAFVVDDGLISATFTMKPKCCTQSLTQLTFEQDLSCECQAPCRLCEAVLGFTFDAVRKIKRQESSCNCTCVQVYTARLILDETSPSIERVTDFPMPIRSAFRGSSKVNGIKK